MIFNETRTEVTPATRKSGIIEVQLCAVNPTNELYEKLTGKKCGFTLDVEDGSQLRVLLKDTEGNFYLQNLEGYDPNRVVGAKDGSKSCYLAIHQLAKIEVLKSTWRPSLEDAKAELGENAFLAHAGVQQVYSLLLGHYFQFVKAVQDSKMFTLSEDGTVDYSQFINHLFTTGDWSLFNLALYTQNLALETGKSSYKVPYYVMVYSETKGNFTNSKVVSKRLMTKFDLYDKEGNLKNTEKGALAQLRLEKERNTTLQGNNVFYSVQIGLVFENEEDIVPNETPINDDLPF